MEELPPTSYKGNESPNNDAEAQSILPNRRTPPRRKSKSRACASPGRGPLHNGLMSAAWPSSPKYPLRSSAMQGQFQSPVNSNGFPEYRWTLWREPIRGSDQEEDMEVDNHDNTLFKPIHGQNVDASAGPSTLVKPSVQTVRSKSEKSVGITDDKKASGTRKESPEKRNESKALPKSPGKATASPQLKTGKPDSTESLSRKAHVASCSSSSDASDTAPKLKEESPCASTSTSAEKSKRLEENTKSKEKLSPIFIVVHTNRIRVGSYSGPARSPVKIYAERMVIQMEDEATSAELSFRIMCNQLTDLQVNFSKVPFSITMKAKTIQNISGSSLKTTSRQNKKGKDSGDTIILDLAYENEVPQDIKRDFEILFRERLADLGLWKDKRHSGQNKEETIDSKQEEKENLQNLNTEDKTIKKEDEEPIVDSPLGGARKRTPSKSMDEEKCTRPTNNLDIKVARRCLFRDTDLIEERIKSLEHEAAHYQLLVGQKRLDVQRLEQQLIQKNAELQRLREEGNSEVARLNDELLAQSNRVSNLERELREESERANDLSRQVQTLETAVGDKDQLIEQHEQAILVRDNQLKQVRCNFKVQEESANPDLKKIVKKAEEDLENTRRMLEETRLTKVNLSEELRRNVELISRLREEVSDGANRQREIEDQLSTRNSRVNELEGENQRLENDLQQYSRRADDADREIQTCRSQLEEERTLKRGLEDQLRELRDRLDENLTRIGHLTAERDSCIAERNSLQCELNSAMDRLRQRGTDLQPTIGSTAYLFHNQTPDWILNRNEIRVSDQTLGVGAWGNVKLGTFRGTPVAVKQIHQLILSPHNRRLFEREMTIASRCRHPCLLQFIGATNDDGIPLFLTEVLETDLRTLLSQQALQEAEILTMSLDITRALNYLHMMYPLPIIHRDISSSNILLWHERNSIRAKLSDYGAANFMRLSMTRHPGASLYSAPDAGTSEQTPKIDIYSFGVLFIEMCLREIPVIQQRTEQLNLVQDTEHRDLVRRCLAEDPTLRPTASELIIIFERWSS